MRFRDTFGFQKAFWPCRFRAIGRGLLLLLAVSLRAGALDLESWPVEVTADRQDALYQVGETAAFKIVIPTKEAAGAGLRAEAVLSHDGGDVLASYPLDLSAGPEFSVTGSLPYPGFLRCTVTLSTGRNRARFLGAAGFNPESIATATVLPDDFRSFWQAGRERLAALDADVRMEPIERPAGEGLRAYRISWANLDDTRMYGFLSVPEGPGPFPALVVIPGAGPGFRGPDRAWARRGVMTLRVNVHPWDPPASRDQAVALYNEWRAQVRAAGSGAPDREAFFYRRIILGLDRAIAWLAAWPDWNGTHLVVTGSSQGGGLTLVLAGFSPHVTAAGAHVPALSDHAGHQVGRSPGGLRLLLRAGRDTDEYLQFSRYYDAVNFARFISIPMAVSVGFIDNTCPPGSVYAAYNVIAAPKTLFPDPRMEHSLSPEITRAMDAWLMQHLLPETEE